MIFVIGIKDNKQCYQIKYVLDIGLFRQLKSFNYVYPNVTTVINNPDILLAIYLDSLFMPVKQLNIMWNRTMSTYITKDYKEILLRMGKENGEKGVEFNLIVESTNENEKYFKSIRNCNVRFLDNIVENIQLCDNRVCVRPFLDEGDDNLAYIVWSNFRPLINQKQQLFDSLWKMSN